MTSNSPSFMRAEIEEIPAAAQRLESAQAQAKLAEAGAFLRDADPLVLVTVARGSSDHAATCLSYAVQLALGIPVASVGPSISSVYGSKLRADRAAMLAISQSGASADLIAVTQMLKEQGASRLVLTNTSGSELAGLADHAIDIAAGPEHAVAATKSFVNSILAGLWLVAHWAQDDLLKKALRALPGAFAKALQAQTPELSALLHDRERFTVTARGPAFGLAQEAALKAQEVLGRGSAAFSAAELLHGPASLMADGHKVLVLSDASNRGVEQAVAQLKDQGAHLVCLKDSVDFPSHPHPLTDTLPQIVAYYSALEKAAQALGFDPDAPRFLKKETVTL